MTLTNLKDRFRFLRQHPGFRQKPLVTAIRLAEWRVRCAIGRPAIVELKAWGASLFLPPLWRGSSKIIFTFRDVSERELGMLNQFLSPGNVFVDAGANYGFYTIVASTLIGEAGRILAFEPAQANFEILTRNIEMNDLRNISPHRLALSDRSGTAMLNIHPDSSRNSLGHDVTVPTTGEEVPLLTLDSILDEESIDCVHLVKIDIEGAEELALRGAIRMLRRAKPVVIFEVQPALAQRLGLTGDGAWNALDDLGYRFFEVDDSYRLRPLAALPSYGNVVAVHPHGIAPTA